MNSFGKWCVCVVHGKAGLKPARSRHQQAFLGLVLTAARLLAPTKSATKAKRQHVLFGRCLLANIAFQALHIHFNRIAYWRHKVSALCVPFFCHSEPKLATLKFLRRQKNLPPTAVNQKDPGFGRFSRSSFEWRFSFFLNRAAYLNAAFWPT